MFKPWVHREVEVSHPWDNHAETQFQGCTSSNNAIYSTYFLLGSMGDMVCSLCLQILDQLLNFTKVYKWLLFTIFFQKFWLINLWFLSILRANSGVSLQALATFLNNSLRSSLAVMEIKKKKMRENKEEPCALLVSNLFTLP